jgi:hypothetical protein
MPYGMLSDATVLQARLFNNPASGVNVLIASDAIGLGLNFNIRYGGGGGGAADWCTSRFGFSAVRP